MTWLRALLNGNGYKNVLEVYIYVQPGDHGEERQRAIRTVRTMHFHAKNNILLQSLKSRASLS